jgi:hypothetical protein
MNKISEFDPYERLANGIILQAVRDYREASRKLAKGRNNADAQGMKDECLRFFHSDWFSVLTDIDPEVLIIKLDQEVSQ